MLPLDNRPFSDLVFDRPRPVPERSRYVYYPGAAAVPEMVAVNVRNRSHRIAATVDIPDPAVGGAPAEGVLVALGSGLGGWTLYLADGRPAYSHNFVSLEEHHIEAEEPVPPGRHEVAFRFERTGEHRGVGHLEVDGVEVARGEIPRFTLTKFSVTGAGLTCGYSDGLPVTRRYEAPFRVHRHHRPRRDRRRRPTLGRSRDRGRRRDGPPVGAQLRRWPNSRPNSSTAWPRSSATTPRTAWSARGR